jgi:negative regulator of sigma E activity
VTTDESGARDARDARGLVMRRVLRWLALVALVPAVACCVLGVIVGVRDGWQATVDGLILESVGCMVAAIALLVLIGGFDG